MDESCEKYKNLENYKNLFSEVRSYEAFKNIQIGMLLEIKPKMLPELAKVVGLKNEQRLHHFLTYSPGM